MGIATNHNRLLGGVNWLGRVDWVGGLARLGGLTVWLLVAVIALSGMECVADVFVVSEQDLLLISDENQTRFAAVKISRFDPNNKTLVYQWYLPETGEKSLAAPTVQSGSMVVQQVHGRAVLPVGPFVLEWHGQAGNKGILSAHGNLGVQPTLIATSGIQQPTAVLNMLEGYHYRQATPQEVADPLGISSEVGPLPRVRAGVVLTDSWWEVYPEIEQPCVRVAAVDEQSPAYRAGLRSGQVVIEVEGKPLNSANEFQDIISRLHPGDTIEVLVADGTSEHQIPVRLETRYQTPATVEVPSGTGEQTSPVLRRRARVGNMMLEVLEALKAVQFD